MALRDRWLSRTAFIYAAIGLAVILALQLKREFVENYGGYPDWAILIGWGVVLIPQKQIKK